MFSSPQTSYRANHLSFIFALIFKINSQLLLRLDATDCRLSLITKFSFSQKTKETSKWTEGFWSSWCSSPCWRWPTEPRGTTGWRTTQQRRPRFWSRLPRSFSRLVIYLLIKWWSPYSCSLSYLTPFHNNLHSVTRVDPSFLFFLLPHES